MNTDNINTVSALLAAWKPHSAGENYSPDHATATLMLDNFEALEMRGIAVHLDGHIAAIAAGFPLSDHSFDIAFSKASDRETGLLHYARRELVKTLPDHYTVINGEEDLGIPGLRRAKQLERPMGQIEMFEAYAQ